MTPDKQQQQSGSGHTTATQSQTQQWLQNFRQNFSNPSDVNNIISGIATYARTLGVTEQQLLDSVNQGYNDRSGQSGSSGSSR